MADEQLIVLDGCTFFSSEANGDVEARDSRGLFYEDVRHLSRWLLRVDGRVLDPLSSRQVDYYSARMVGKPGGDADRPGLTVRRDRFVSEGVHEDIVVENLCEPREVEIECSMAPTSPT